MLLIGAVCPLVMYVFARSQHSALQAWLRFLQLFFAGDDDIICFMWLVLEELVHLERCR